MTHLISAFAVQALSTELTIERVITAGSGITVTDGGAGGPLTFATPLATTLAGLATNITAGKTLTLASTGDFELTVPATGTVAMLGVANVFTQGITIRVANPRLTLENTMVGGQTLVFFAGTGGLGFGNPTYTQQFYVDATSPDASISISSTGTVIGGILYSNTLAPKTAGGPITLSPRLRILTSAVPFTAGAESGGLCLGGGVGLLYGMFAGNNSTTGDSWIGCGRTDSATYYNLLLQVNGGKVVVGSGTPTAKLSVFGESDISQFTVTGHSTQAVATPMAQITRNDAAAGVSAMLGLTALGSGANGDGGSILMRGKSSTTAAQLMADLDWLWTDATHASRTAKLVISPVLAATKTDRVVISTTVQIGDITGGKILEVLSTGVTKTMGRRAAVATKAADYTLTVNDEVVVFTAVATATLPAATGTGQTYRIANEGTANVTIDGNGAETIKGETTQILYPGEDQILTDYAAGKWA